MERLVKTFSNNSYLKYDRGGFDNWCVYLVNAYIKGAEIIKRPGIIEPPKDGDYFTALQLLSQKYTPSRIYDTFIQVYNLVTKEVRETDINFITKLASEYPEDSLSMDIILTIGGLYN